MWSNAHFYVLQVSELLTLKGKPMWEFQEVTMSQSNQSMLIHGNSSEYCWWNSSLSLTHQYTILQDKEKAGQTLSKPTCKHVRFSWKYKEKKFFYGYNILTGVFLTQLSNNAGISFWQTV